MAKNWCLSKLFLNANFTSWNWKKIIKMKYEDDKCYMLYFIYNKRDSTLEEY